MILVDRFFQLTNSQTKALTVCLGLFCLCLSFLFSCSAKQAVQPEKISGSTMGTSYSIIYFLPDSSNARSLDSEMLKTDVDKLLERIEQGMSTYRNDSELSRFNQSEQNSWHKLSPELMTVLLAAQEVSIMSAGAFDISVGPLVNLWGFGPGFTVNQIPQQQRINDTLANIGFKYLELDANTKSAKKSKALYLDLSAIAKGYGVDQLAELLEQKGITNYLVEIGGELRASGTKPNSEPWKVAIEKPNLNLVKREIEEILYLKDISIASSGDYRNFFEHDGKLYSHTINPVTGKPVEHQLASVTVLHSSCMYADALATAMMVMGPDLALAFAESQQLAVLLLVRQGEHFEHISSKALQSFVRQQNPL